MLETEVLRRHEPRCDQVGRKLPDTLYATSEQIDPALAMRLHSYAHERLTDLGFPIDGWVCCVSAADGDLPPDERFYVVDFRHSKGAVIGVQGILLGSDGVPCLDHGLCIDAEDATTASDVVPSQPAEQQAACEDEQAKSRDAHQTTHLQVKTIAFCNQEGEESTACHNAATKPSGTSAIRQRGESDG